MAVIGLLIIILVCILSVNSPHYHPARKRSNYGGSYTGKRMAKRMIRRSFR